MSGLNLLFIHGAGGTKSKWRSVEPFFTDYTYQSINLPGHGDDSSEVALTIEENASLIEQYIKDDTIIVGHSMGGLVGLELASRNNKVKGLVLAASSFELPVHHSILDSLEEGVFPNSLFYASYSKEVDETLLAEEKKEKESTPVDISRIDFRACNDYKEGESKLESLKIPIAAIYGNEDRLIPSGIGEKLQVVNKNVKVFEIEKSGHFPILEKAEAFSKALQIFLNDVTK